MPYKHIDKSQYLKRKKITIDGGKEIFVSMKFNLTYKEV